MHDKIIYAVLTTYERHGWVHPSILQLFTDMPRVTGENCFVVPLNNFQPAASARNVFGKNYKDAEVDWLCMIDNDMAMPAPEVFLKITKDAPKDAGIVVPQFYLWDQTKMQLVLCWGIDEIERMVIAQGSGFHELSKCGTGVMFVRPWVFQKLTYPYFFYVYNSDCGMDGTEDIQFCLKAREAGIKIYGNANVTVGHYHNVELSSMNIWLDKRLKAADNLGQKDSQAFPETAPAKARSAEAAKAIA